MTQRSISYKWASSDYRLGRDDGLRLRVDITGVCGMSSKVFAYRMFPVNPQTGEVAGTFSHICSSSDLEEMPEDAPVAGQAPQWFRLSYVDVLVRSVSEATDFLAIIRQDLATLKSSLDNLDILAPGGTGKVGTVSCDEDSSSSSAMPSLSLEPVLGPLHEIAAFATFVQNGPVGPENVRWTLAGEGLVGDPESESVPTSFATVTLSFGEVSSSLILQGFDFTNIPDDAIIEGIVLRVWVKGTDPTPLAPLPSLTCPITPLIPETSLPPILKELSLHHPSLGQLKNVATGEALSETGFTMFEAGSETELWGAPNWTPALIKQGEFGVLLAVAADPGTAGSMVSVDGAEIVVYYASLIPGSLPGPIDVDGLLLWD